MSIYFVLFSTSIALVGFIAVFLVFRYAKIDTYVDNRKPVLRQLLWKKIAEEPSIVVRIQNIGKGLPEEDIKFFKRFGNEGVNSFVQDIIEFRAKRARAIRLGLISISSWIFLSLMYILLGWLVLTTKFKIEFNIISITLFYLSMSFTLYFIVVSLSGVRLKSIGFPNDKTIKNQYKQSFRDRRKTLDEGSIKSRLYRLRYEFSYRHLREQIQSRDAVIVDAGCGDGVFLSMLANRYSKVVGLDLSVKSLKYLKNRDDLKHVSLVQGDIEEMPLLTNSVDAVVCLETLEHLTDIEKGLQEIHRVLRPRGVFIATVPSALNPRNIAIVGECRGRLLSFLAGVVKIALGIGRGYVRHSWQDETLDFKFPHRVYWRWKIIRTFRSQEFIIKSITNTPFVITSRVSKFIVSIERIINKLTRNFFGETIVICAVKKKRF